MSLRIIAATATAVLLVALGAATLRHHHQIARTVRVDPSTLAGQPTPTPAARIRATTSMLIRSQPLFGLSVSDRTHIPAIVAETGCGLGLNEFFVSVAGGISASTLDAIVGTPVISLEPWHPGLGPNQPDFTLEATVNGAWDDQYREIAAVVAAYPGPILIRFAHEMNGNWYPWGYTNGTNTRAAYIAAWRHVVTLFRRAGASNALWVWSPNIIWKGAGTGPWTPDQYYPGNAYVDFTGLTGYGNHLPNAAQTYNATMAEIAKVSKKPMILTEVGADGPDKTKWIAGFGEWLSTHPIVKGIIWFNKTTADGADGDWSYDNTPAHLTAFRIHVVPFLACG